MWHKKLHTYQLKQSHTLSPHTDSWFIPNTLQNQKGYIMLLILIGGIATAINFILILHKLRHRQFVDASIDAGTMVVISALFVGTLTGMAIGMVASAFLSAYLLAFPFGSQKSILDVAKQYI